MTTTARIWAVTIHGATGQQLAEGWIEAGATITRIERVGPDRARLIIDGAIEETDLESAEAAGLTVPPLKDAWKY